MMDTEIETVEFPVVEHESRTVTIPKGQDIWKRDAQRAVDQAKTIKVVDSVSYVRAGDLRSLWMAKSKAMFVLLNPACQESDRLHKKLVKDRDEITGPYDNAAKLAKAELMRYDDEAERKRQEEQRRLEAEVRCQEEERRQTALKQAQDEAQRQMDARKREEDERIVLAQTLQDAGATEAAEVVLQDAAIVAPVDTSAITDAMAELNKPIEVNVVAPLDKPKITGYSKRKIWSAVVKDRKAYLAGLVAGTIPDLAWEPNETFLREQAGSLKEALVWPGVTVSSREV
jgi:hypothetical protein